MSKGLYTLTGIVFVLNLFIAIFCTTFSVLSIFVIQAFPPVIIFFALAVCFILLSVHYYRCLTHLKGAKEYGSKVLKWMRATNAAVLFVSFFTCISMIMILFYACIVLGFYAEFHLYFLFVCIVSILYLIDGCLLISKLQKHPLPQNEH